LISFAGGELGPHNLPPLKMKNVVLGERKGGEGRIDYGGVGEKGRDKDFFGGRRPAKREV